MLGILNYQRITPLLNHSKSTMQFSIFNSKFSVCSPSPLISFFYKNPRLKCFSLLQLSPKIKKLTHSCLR